MNSETEKASDLFREAITNAIVPIQTAHIIKDDKLENLNQVALKLTNLLKGHDLVSKSLLNEFYGIVQILRAEAPYFGNDKIKLQTLADKIELYFGLILENESLEDRIAGVPRVI
ncbi:MAG: hypothetical protein LBK71_12545 [Verrucomicrobiales bacterium]|jgi:hypothetical protein|nr:hypothetical protein [Verrucomicrobiales bacterium]